MQRLGSLPQLLKPDQCELPGLPLATLVTASILRHC